MFDAARLFSGADGGVNEEQNADASTRGSAQRESGDRAGTIALTWGLNGVASVVGSLCAAMAAKAFGFSTVLAFGAACYVVAALLLLAARSRNAES